MLKGLAANLLAGTVELGVMTTGVIHAPAVLLAQAPAAAAPFIDSGLAGLIGNVGIMGVLVWHLYYHTTKSYPAMLDRFSQEQERLRGAFEKGQEAARTAFETELARVRDAHATHQNRLVDSHDKDMARLRDAHSKEVERLQGMIDRMQTLFVQSVGEMRRAVHDVRDTAHSAVVKTAEIAERGMNGGHDSPPPPGAKKP